MGGRAHGRDGLRVGRQLQSTRDRAGPIHQCSGWPGDSSWPLCFPTDVPTSGPALLCSPFVLYPSAPRSLLCAQPAGEGVWGLQQRAVGHRDRAVGHRDRADAQS